VKKCKFFVLFLCVSLRSEKWDYRVPNEYGTHQPVLYEIVNRTKGPVVEFGCGNGSTDLLHEICKKQGRLLISIDDDLSWLNKYRQKYLGDGCSPDNSGWHLFFYVPGKKGNSHDHWLQFFKECSLLNNLNFELCFVDQSPWLARYETIKKFRNKVKYIILHDCDFFPRTGICGKVIKHSDSAAYVPGVFDFSDIFAYFKVYFPPAPWPLFSGPPTLLGSNFISDLPDVDYIKYSQSNL